ncbi:MAG: hypothetical protein AAF404_12355 [Pseudomonadota bacterium]
MKYLRDTAAVVLLLPVAAGCNGSSEPAPMSDDQPLLSDAQSCPVPPPDFAEQLFTETDRQWFCSVTTAELQTEDEVFFSRNGQAVTSRFREVYWNRSLEDDSINVASPFISPFVIRNIFSANTVLTFEVIRQTGDVESYDCVLVGREVAAPELI